MTLILPFVATIAKLLPNTSDCPMTLLISQILPDALPFPPVLSATLVSICLIALFASDLQPVLSVTIPAKLTDAPALPLLALGAVFLLPTTDGTMRLLIAVVFLCHSLAAEPVSISQSLNQKLQNSKFGRIRAFPTALIAFREE
jgi:hypothetical protein